MFRSGQVRVLLNVGYYSTSMNVHYPILSKQRNTREPSFTLSLPPAHITAAPTRAPYSGSHDFLALSPPAKRQRSDAYESFATPGPSMAGSGAPAREMARLAALQRHQQSVASTPVAPFSLPLKDDDEDVGSDEDLRRAIRESQADAGHSSGGDVDELQLALK